MKAFPNPTLSDTQNNSPETLNDRDEYGMDLRDYFAAHAPNPDENYITMHQSMDHNRNPNNDPDKHKRRSKIQIIAEYKFEYADAMMKAREK